MDSSGRLDRSLSVLQQTSGLVFSSFSILHLSGHLLATCSFSLADSALFISRVYYQNPTIELFVVGGSLLVHVGSSVTRVVLRNLRRQKVARALKDTSAEALKKETRDGEAIPLTTAVAFKSPSVAVQERNWHRYTGWFMTPLVFGHVFATRVTPILVLDDPSMVDLTQITYALNGKLRYVYFAYLTLFGTAGIYHTAYGMQQALSMLRIAAKRIKPGTWTKVLYVSAALMTTSVLAISGLFETIPVPLASKWKMMDENMIKAGLGLIGL